MASSVCEIPASEFGSFLTAEYELLRLVLSHLPMKDLQTCALVCSTWAKVVDVIKRTRKSLEWGLCCADKKNSAELKEWTREVHSCLSGLVDSCFSEPNLTLCFSIFSGLDYGSVDSQLLLPPLPRSHRLAVIESRPGVVGTHHRTFTTTEMENDLYSLATSFVILPRRDDVYTRVFTDMDWDAEAMFSKETLSDKELEKYTGVTPEDKVAALLLFVSQTDEDGDVKVNVVTRSFLRRCGSKLPIGGAVVDDTMVYDTNAAKLALLTGIVFCGSGVRAASTYLSESVRTRSKVEKRLKKLKSCGLPMNDSVAFMMACELRGRDLYKASGVESSVFRELFPRTPIVGLFGFAGICHKHFPNYNATSTHRRQSEDIVMDNYHSSYLLLSFDK